MKCLVWDLDHTLWDGILLEDDNVTLRPGVVDVIRALDQRGILQSIASRNDHTAAMTQLQTLDLAGYFLYPQINWQAKSESIRQIAEKLNIGLDTIAFIDDQPFEREEVAHTLPEVRCFDAQEAARLPNMADFTPRFITADSQQRRLMYQANIQREEAEATFHGPSEAFLATLGMRFTIDRATESDLRRAEELTIRTNQLNTTGYTYDYDELNTLRQSAGHLLLIAGLEDKFGTYGRIGLALVEKGTAVWQLKLLLMSCRVMSRGVGNIMLIHIMQLARQAGARLQAEFRANGRNRMMMVTYRFAGFQTIWQENGRQLLEHDLQAIPSLPNYVEVITDLDFSS